MKKVYLKIIKEKSGVSLVQVLIIAAALSAAIVVISKTVEMMKKSSSTMGKTHQYRALAGGALVYAQYLLEKRKCLNLSTGLTNKACNGLWDKGNLERLLLFPQTINDINVRFPKYKTKKISRLNKLELNIPANSLNVDHPLYPLMKAKGISNVTSIKVEYQSKFNARLGNVNKVIINVYVMAKVKGAFTGKVAEVMNGKREILVYPRVNNYYSLVMNGDLVIGPQKKISLSGRDGRGINQFDFPATGKGMTFYSPLFVNGNLYLPKAEMDEVKKLLFYSPIYIGKSLMTTDNKSFVAAVDAANDTFLDYPSYKGLLSGVVRVDHEKSLERLFDKDYSGKKPNLEAMNYCIDYAKRRFERAPTFHSRILVKEGKDHSELKLGLTKLNEFISVDQLSSLKGLRNTKNKDIYGYFELDESPEQLPKLGIRLEWQEINYWKKRWLKDQLAAGDKLILKGKLTQEMFKFDKYTVYDSQQHKCVKHKTLKPYHVAKEANYPEVKISAKDYVVLGAVANNRIKLGIEVDYKDSVNLTTHASTSQVVEWIQPPDEQQVTYDASGNEVVNWVTPPQKMIVKPGKKLPPVVCGLTGEWKEKPDIFIRAYNFRSNPFAPRKVTDEDWGGPNDEDYDDSREIKLKKIDRYINGKKYDDAALEFEQKDIDGQWRYLEDFKKAKLSKDEEKSLSDLIKPIDSFQYCKNNEPSGSTVSSIPSGINTNFSESAYVSWNYNPISKDYQYKPGVSSSQFWGEVFAKSSSRIFLNELVVSDANDILFHVYSVVDRCIVRSSARFFSGFMVCRHMIIESRKKPLKMLGSFVVDKLTISPKAFSAGIEWMNVHRKESQKQFRKNGILNSSNSCDVDANKPKWYIPTTKPKEQCNSASLSAIADPFIWTSFNPSCGLEAKGDLVTKCKPYSRAENFVSVVLQEVYNF